uniref:Transmembrane protein n=1 Tax=Branchiostoma floridae TaxID=7739 RepID=C3YEX4_BRAFL|eukprot:XP_002605208.1 hypothetical protein BRAFLDRAFT_80852 [Branchiostoma floridae]
MEEVGTQPDTFVPATADLEPPKPDNQAAPERLRPEPSFDSKPPNKVGRALLVVGYLFGISAGAIALVVFYSFFWTGDAELFPSTGGGMNATTPAAPGAGDGGGGEGNDGGNDGGGGGNGNGGDMDGGSTTTGGDEEITATASATTDPATQPRLSP